MHRTDDSTRAKPMRSRFRKGLLAVLGALCTAACTPLATHPGTSPPAPARAVVAAPDVALSRHALAASIDAWMSSEQTRGFSGVVRLTLPGEPPIERRYGALATRSPDTRFWVGSLAKPITATAILKLQETGRLHVGDTLQRFFPQAPADKRGITIAQLLTHTAGMPDRYIAEGETERDAAARKLLAEPLAQPPGTGVAYSNDGFMLLAIIVERASGRAWSDYVRDEILRPAGMHDTTFWPQDLGSDRMAPIAALPAPALRVPHYGYRGSTGIASNATDLEHFMRALLAGRILRAKDVHDALATRISRPDARDVGYGWFSETYGGGRLLSHSGAESGLGHFSWLYLFEPSQAVLVVLSDSAEDRAAEVVDGVVGRIATAQRRALQSAGAADTPPAPDPGR